MPTNINRNISDIYTHTHTQKDKIDTETNFLKFWNLKF